MSGMDRNSNTSGNEGAQLGDQLKQQASHVGERAKEKLGETTERLGQRMQTFSEQQKATGADQVEGIASAVHAAGREMERQMPGAASLVHSAADGLSSTAAALRERNINELLHDIRDFAQREPVLFFGGAFVAGFAIARFLKSSADADISAQRMTDGTGAYAPGDTDLRRAGDAYAGGVDGL